MDLKINQYEVLPVEPLKFKSDFPYDNQEVKRLIFKEMKQDRKQGIHSKQLEFQFGK